MAANVTAGRQIRGKICRAFVGRQGPGSVGGSLGRRRPLLFCMLPKKMGQLNDDEGGEEETGRASEREKSTKTATLESSERNKWRSLPPSL